MNFFEIAEIIRCDLTTINWFRNNRLIVVQPRCRICTSEMILTKKERVINKYIWRCRIRKQSDSHDIERGMLVGSRFEDSKIPLKNILLIIYEWSFSTTIKNVAEKVGNDRKSVSRIYKKLRGLCKNFYEQNHLILGGQNLVVQIDESKFVKLKNNRGEPRGNVLKKFWVFGIYCVTSKKVFIKLVSNRKQNTLFPLIRTHVVPNTIIWSDEFSVYTGGPNYSTERPSPLSLLGPYVHQVVCHRYEFVDTNTGVHTNHIEGLWGGAKKIFRNMHGCLNSSIQDYLYVFMWKYNECHHENIFSKIVNLIADFSFE